LIIAIGGPITACRELTGIVEDLFIILVEPPAGGAGVVPGGQVTATVRVQNGANVRTTIWFSVATPDNVTGRVELGANESELVLEPDEIRDLPLIINVYANQPVGGFTVTVTAEGSSVRTDIAGGGDFEDTQTATLDVMVAEDEGPPSIVIESPESGAVFDGLAISTSVVAMDDGSVAAISYQLNGDAPRRVWTLGDDDDPATTVSHTFEIPNLEGSSAGGPRVGTNTLIVATRDALGQAASASIDFIYQPTGQCENVVMVPSRANLTAAPGDQVALRVAIAPQNGWTGRLEVHFDLRGMFVSASNPSFDVSGPFEAIVGGNLTEELTPGDPAHLYIRAETRSEPRSLCEIAVPLTLVAPGTGAPPSVTIDSPPPDMTTTNPNFTFNATATDDGTITEVYYQNEFDVMGLVDVIVADTPSPYSFTESLTLVEGINVIRVFAVDNEGRRSSSAVSVTYDPDGGGGMCSEFTMEASPGEMAAVPGNTDYAGILINRIDGFSGAVLLNIEEPFATTLFDSISFEPNPTNGNSTMALTVTDGPSAVEFIGGTYQFTVVGRTESSQCSTTFTMEVLDG
jgi:hypothetical protein